LSRCARNDAKDSFYFRSPVAAVAPAACGTAAGFFGGVDSRFIKSAGIRARPVS
jgi:hypothetical protein